MGWPRSHLAQSLTTPEAIPKGIGAEGADFSKKSECMISEGDNQGSGTKKSAETMYFLSSETVKTLIFLVFRSKCHPEGGPKMTSRESAPKAPI